MPRAADRHLVGRRGLEVAHLPQPLDDRLARLIAIEAREFAARLVDPSLLVEDVDHGQAVADRERVVIRVMSGGDLDRAGPELLLDRIIGDDLEGAAQEWQDRALADQVAVPQVVGVHGDSHVAQQRLWTRGRHADPAVRTPP